MLMTIPDSKAGRSRTKTKTFTSKDKLSGAAVGSKWNRVKIKCLQKHSSEQFGLQFITFSNNVGHRDGVMGSVGTPSSHSHLLTPPQLSVKNHVPVTPKSEPVTRHSRLPVLSKSSTPAVVVRSKTPKRPLKERNSQERETEDEDFEFSGLEKQSRLFRNCMKGKPSTNSSSEKESNPILERIMTDREKYTNTSSDGGGLYPRKKLLKRELPKADVSVDFTASYKDSGGGGSGGGGKKKAGELSGAWSKMSSHGGSSCSYGHIVIV